jgi:hypothetical protein
MIPNRTCHWFVSAFGKTDNKGQQLSFLSPHVILSGPSSLCPFLLHDQSRPFPYLSLIDLCSFRASRASLTIFGTLRCLLGVGGPIQSETRYATAMYVSITQRTHGLYPHSQSLALIIHLDWDCLHLWRAQLTYYTAALLLLTFRPRQEMYLFALDSHGCWTRRLYTEVVCSCSEKPQIC